MEHDPTSRQSSSASFSSSPVGSNSRTSKKLAVMVSSVSAEADSDHQIGQQDYSYHFIYRAFAPLLQRWAHTIEVTRPESRLDYALWRARQQGLEPVHISFLPLHSLYLTSHARNVAFTLWGLPDIPNEDLGNNPRNNLMRIANHVSLILTASTFARNAFIRAGVKSPVHTVPVPVRSEYFAVSDWVRDQQVILECPAYWIPQPKLENPSGQKLSTHSRWPSVQKRAKNFYGAYVKSHLPRRIAQLLTSAARAGASMQNADDENRVSYSVSSSLRLSGVVYTAFVNPFDPAMNWEDMLSAYLLALRSREDATLVIKLVTSSDEAARGVNRIVHYYESLGLRHRCKLAVISGHLSDAQLVELARGSTYYLNTSRAEGACLPLQEFLAAGRPSISPNHTAMADYFHDQLGFVVACHPEPAQWPHDPERRCVSTWHRLVWQSLHDQIQASYEMAKGNTQAYQALASHARNQMFNFASVERVWSLLSAALDSIIEGRGEH
jgi:glycosyltransferase involved in cell wall biosynthesis